MSRLPHRLAGVPAKLRLRLGLNKPCAQCGAPISRKVTKEVGICRQCAAASVLGRLVREALADDLGEYERLWVKRLRYSKKGSLAEEGQITRTAIRINGKIHAVIPGQVGAEFCNALLAEARSRAETLAAGLA